MEGLWVDGVMRDRPIYAAQSSRGTNATLTTLSRPPDVPIMFLLCRLRRRRRVVRPRGKLYELTPFKHQVELHRARRVEREFDHHQVRRIVIARSRGTLEHAFQTFLWVSLETAHSQEPLRARNHAWNPLSNRIIHSFELRAPLSAPPQQCLSSSLCRCATTQLPQGQGRSDFALRVRRPGRRADRAQGRQAEHVLC